MARQGEGRTAQKVRALLKAIGYDVIHFYIAQGAYRSDVRQDCYRWSASCLNPEGFERTVDSWYTLTELAKAKALSVDSDYEVFPVTEKPTTT